MKYYKLLYLYWVIPAYLLFLTVYQVTVYYALQDTYKNGESYTAEVVKMNIKQIASQTNGYIIIRFKTNDGEIIQQKLGMPVQLAGKLSDTQIIPVRYKKDNFEDIVMMPVYKDLKDMNLANAGMAFFGFLATGLLGFLVNRYVKKRTSGEDRNNLVIERVD